MCLYRGKKLKYRDTSDILGYGLKMAKRPNMLMITKSGCLFSRIVKAPTKLANSSQNTPIKKFRKESNISIKKYHQRPTFGVRSVTEIWAPYVAS